MNIKKQFGKSMVAVFMFVGFFVLFGVVPNGLFAATTCPDPTNYTMVSGVCFPTSTGLSDKPIVDILKSVMNWLLAVLGFIAIIGFAISGVQYLTSAGDEKMIETAKTNMKYSIIGVIVALSGFVVIQAIDSLLKAGTAF